MKRCNLEETDAGIRLCRGLHEKAEPCNWEYFVPVAAVVAEREACAKVCNEKAFVAAINKARVFEDGTPVFDPAALDCAAGAMNECADDIRERSNAIGQGSAACGASPAPEGYTS